MYICIYGDRIFEKVVRVSICTFPALIWSIFNGFLKFFFPLKACEKVVKILEENFVKLLAALRKNRRKCSHSFSPQLSNSRSSFPFFFYVFCCPSNQLFFSSILSRKLYYFMQNWSFSKHDLIFNLTITSVKSTPLLTSTIPIFRQKLKITFLSFTM